MLFSGDSRTGFVIIYLPLEVAPPEFRDEKYRSNEG